MNDKQAAGHARGSMAHSSEHDKRPQMSQEGRNQSNAAAAVLQSLSVAMSNLPMQASKLRLCVTKRYSALHANVLHSLTIHPSKRRILFQCVQCPLYVRSENASARISSRLVSRVCSDTHSCACNCVQYVRVKSVSSCIQSLTVCEVTSCIQSS